MNFKLSSINYNCNEYHNDDIVDTIVVTLPTEIIVFTTEFFVETGLGVTCEAIDNFCGMSDVYAVNGLRYNISCYTNTLYNEANDGTDDSPNISV